MGLRSDTPSTGSSIPVIEPPANTQNGPSESVDLLAPSAARFGLAGMEDPQRLRVSDWLFRSHQASVLWLLVRIWLGYQWISAGYQKIWGSERSAFWFGGGTGVKGFATAGVAGSTAGKGTGASYGWWAGFLHNFVIPNSAWIGKFISLTEILIGVAILLGFLTGAAAAAGLSLNLVYMFTGSAGVNPMYGILSVLLVLAWRNAGWFGLDPIALPAWRRLRLRAIDSAPTPGTAPKAVLVR